MNKFTGYLLYAFAFLLYLLTAVTFISFLYAITIRDTLSAVESAFGTFVITIAMLVMAKFARDAAKTRLSVENDADSDRNETSASTSDSET